MPRLLPRACAPLLAAGAFLVPGACTADAAPAATVSSNWSGYAVQHSGLKFRHISAAWTIPTARCDGADTASAAWVGLGGYETTSQALEQIGTEADCASGRPDYSTWYEIVPDVSHSARLTVRPGDRMNASVDVSGHTVTLHMANATRHTSFTKTIVAPSVDTSSAEWIVEAPAACLTADQSSCQVLDLANFGATKFAQAKVTSSGGHVGSISDPHWRATAIALQPEGDLVVAGPRRVVQLTTSGAAVPTTLSGTGSSFTVTYAAPQASTPAGSGADPGAPIWNGRRLTHLAARSRGR